jgi:hypothetical protein
LIKGPASKLGRIANFGVEAVDNSLEFKLLVTIFGVQDAKFVQNHPFTFLKGSNISVGEVKEHTKVLESEAWVFIYLVGRRGQCYLSNRLRECPPERPDSKNNFVIIIRRLLTPLNAACP